MSTVNFMTMEGSDISQRKRSSRCLLCWALLATCCVVGLTIAIIVLSSKSGDKYSSSVTWCTVNKDEQSKCLEMSNAFSDANLQPGVKCVMKTNLDSCITALENGEVDSMTVDGGHLYKERSKLKPVMAEDYGLGDATYWAVAVVKKSDSSTFFTQTGLSGKKACHTGYQKSAGWNMPMGAMKSQGILTISQGTCDIFTAAINVFDTICAPGGESVNSRLCSGCNGTCNKNCDGEIYCGYTGAFRCLVAGGDVAFVKHTTVYENSDGRNKAEWAKSLRSSDYQLLCKDGNRAPLSAYESCSLGKVPSHAVVVSNKATDSVASAVVELLLIGQLKFGYHTSGQFRLFGGAEPDLLFKSSTKLLLPLKTTCDARTFLGSSYLINQLELNCASELPPNSSASCVLPQYSNDMVNSLRWCVTSDNEEKKCQTISDKAHVLDSGLQVFCIKDKDVNACAQRIYEGTADGITMDGGHIFDAGVKYNLQPVAAENYGTGSDSAISYYAVAVIKANDTTTKLTRDGLHLKKTCHTGYQKTAGWNVPVGYLTESGILSYNKVSCNIPESLANFFNGSCVPGIITTSVDPVVKDNLCKICSGIGTRKCTPDDPFSGYSGAFRCLESGAGDIAFIKHATVLDSTRKSEFKLLCKDGTTKDPSQYATCNIAKVPSHTFMISSSRSYFYREKVWGLLNQLQKDPALFSSTGFGGSDLLFKDSTRCLLKIDSSCTWADLLGSDYIKSVQGTRCETGNIVTKECRYSQPSNCPI